MTAPVLHPDNKVEYLEGTHIEFVIDGNIDGPVYTGKIVGIAVRGIIDIWIIKLDTILDNWAYSTVTIPHMFIRPKGSNMPFLCENKEIIS